MRYPVIVPALSLSAGLAARELFRLSKRRHADQPPRKKKPGAEKRANETDPPAPVGPPPTGFWGGGKATTVAGIPGYLPALVGAGVAGAGGGYYLADKLIDRKRKADLKAEVDEVRRQYEQALLANYQEPGGRLPAVKQAAAAALGDALETAAAAAGVTAATPPAEAAAAGTAAGRAALAAAGREKAAFSWGDTAGHAVGLYGAAAVPAAILAGLAMYRYSRSRSTKDLLEKAVKRRQRELEEAHPPEVRLVVSRPPAAEE